MEIIGKFITLSPFIFYLFLFLLLAYKTIKREKIFLFIVLYFLLLLIIPFFTKPPLSLLLNTIVLLFLVTKGKNLLILLYEKGYYLLPVTLVKYRYVFLVSFFIGFLLTPTIAISNNLTLIKSLNLFLGLSTSIFTLVFIKYLISSWLSLKILREMLEITANSENIKRFRLLNYERFILKQHCVLVINNNKYKGQLSDFLNQDNLFGLRPNSYNSNRDIVEDFDMLDIDILTKYFQGYSLYEKLSGNLNPIALKLLKLIHNFGNFNKSNNNLLVLETIDFLNVINSSTNPTIAKESFAKNISTVFLVNGKSTSQLDLNLYNDIISLNKNINTVVLEHEGKIDNLSQINSNTFLIDISKTPYEFINTIKYVISYISFLKRPDILDFRLTSINYSPEFLSWKLSQNINSERSLLPENIRELRFQPLIQVINKIYLERNYVSKIYMIFNSLEMIIKTLSFIENLTAYNIQDIQILKFNKRQKDFYISDDLRILNNFVKQDFTTAASNNTKEECRMQLFQMLNSQIDPFQLRFEDDLNVLRWFYPEIEQKKTISIKLIELLNFIKLLRNKIKGHGIVSNLIATTTHNMLLKYLDVTCKHLNYYKLELQKENELILKFSNYAFKSEPFILNIDNSNEYLFMTSYIDNKASYIRYNSEDIIKIEIDRHVFKNDPVWNIVDSHVSLPSMHISEKTKLEALEFYKSALSVKGVSTLEDNSPCLIDNIKEYLSTNLTEPISLENNICNYIVTIDEEYDKVDFRQSLLLYKGTFDFLESHAKIHLSEIVYKRIYKAVYERIKLTIENLENVEEPLSKFMSVPIFELALKPIRKIGYKRFLKFVNFYTSKSLNRIILMLFGVIFFTAISSAIFSTLPYVKGPSFYFVYIIGHVMYIFVYIVLLSNLNEIINTKSDNLNFKLRFSIAYVGFLMILLLLNNNILLNIKSGYLSVYIITLFFLLAIMMRINLPKIFKFKSKSQ